jgi:hypothetical protein
MALALVNFFKKVDWKINEAKNKARWVTSKHFKRKKTKIKQSMHESFALHARTLDSENESTFTSYVSSYPAL